MYFPQSQIQCNLYSNGELSVKKTQEVYIGHYWSTSTGKFYAGKSPNKEFPIELVKPSEASINRNNEGENSKTFDCISYSSFDVVNYLELNTKINPDKFPQTPFYISPKPTKKDYENQEFTRFFCKKINEPKFIEVNKDTYIKLVEENPELDYETYRPFKINWVIAGNQQKVARENKNAIDYAENKLGALGLAIYLQYNYLLYYNLTPGVTKVNSKRVYADNGKEVPLNLPPNYRLEKENMACLKCVYNKGGNCVKWNSPIRNNYYCQAYKPISLTEKEKTQIFLDSFSSSPNIYNQ